MSLVSWLSVWEICIVSPCVEAAATSGQVTHDQFTCYPYSYDKRDRYLIQCSVTVSVLIDHSHRCRKTVIMTTLGRARVDKTTTWGLSKDNFWVEYPSGLVDLSRTPADGTEEPRIKDGQFEFNVLNDRRLRIAGSKSAVIIVDMQKCVMTSLLFPAGRNLSLLALLASSFILTYEHILWDYNVSIRCWKWSLIYETLALRSFGGKLP